MNSDLRMHEVKIQEEFEQKPKFFTKKLKIIISLLTISVIILLICIIMFYKTNDVNSYTYNSYYKLNLKKHYDYLLVGAGLFNAVLTEYFIRNGKSVLVLEKREHIAGNCYTEKKFNIDVHVYGPHIFHTSDKEVWEYINQFGEFKHTNFGPIAMYDNELYSLPFNMNTFYKLFGTKTPEEAKKKIQEEIKNENIKNITNLEEQAISMVGRTIYEKLIKEYTEKQWERDCKDLDPSIIKRLPLRFTYDNNYYNDKFQGIPEDGYTNVIKNMYKGADIIYGVDFLREKEKWENMADKIFYSGCIDEYYNYKYGDLQYRNVRFVEKVLDMENYQGTAVINYPSKKYPYTRITEHKHFVDNKSNKTVLFEEYSSEWKKGMVPYYPINDKKNMDLFQKYKNIKNDKVQFVGRLGMYKYFDMDDTIIEAFKVLEKMGYRKKKEEI